MLRFGMLASSIPLLVLGVLAGEHLTPAAQPCISLGDSSVQIAYAPWQHADHVAFTDDPAAATVRVQLVDRPDLADFTVVDDVDASAQEADDTASCRITASTRYVAISEHAAPSEPVIYLSDRPGDYRLYIRSRHFSIKQAAALLIEAAPRQGRLELSQL